MRKNKQFKIIFVDLDWTLLNHKKHCFDMKSIKGLIKAQKRGIKVFICTARPYDSLKGTGIFDVFTPDGTICTNGAVIFIKDKLIYQKVMPPHFVKTLLDIANDNNIVIEFSDTKTRWFNKSDNEYVRRYFSSYSETFPSVQEYKYQCVNSILLFGEKDIDDLILKGIKQKISYHRFSDIAVDIALMPQHKSEGIEFLLNYLDIPKENSISFGDDYPDIKMFEATGLGVAVTPIKGVQEKADFISKDIQKSGVYYALRKLKII